MSDSPELNPRARLHVTRRAGDPIAVTLTAPVRGRPLRVTEVVPAGEPALFDLLVRIASRAGPVDADLDAATWARLVDIGLLVAPGDVSRPVRFHCSPIAPPRDLVPRRAQAMRIPPLRHLRVSPGLAVVEGTPPQHLAADRAWIRVEHVDMPLPSVFSFHPREHDLLRRLVPGGVPPGLTPDLAASLALAGILVDPEMEEARHTAWTIGLAEASERLRRARYAVLRGLVHPFQLAALRRYYRELVAEGHVGFGDGQVPLRYHAHNEPLARMLHASLTGFVSELAGEPFKPSYVYACTYLAGAALEPHRDREQCELSLSLQVDFTPEPEDRIPWPLRVEDTSISLGLGDALVYRGRELTHARYALPEGQTSTSIFFHYVPQGFAGNLD
jgi:hypothetical protein